MKRQANATYMATYYDPDADEDIDVEQAVTTLRVSNLRQEITGWITGTIDGYSEDDRQPAKSWVLSTKCPDELLENWQEYTEYLSELSAWRRTPESDRGESPSAPEFGTAAFEEALLNSNETTTTFALDKNTLAEEE